MLPVHRAVSCLLVQIVALLRTLAALLLQVEVARRLALDLERDALGVARLLTRDLGLVELRGVDVLVKARDNAKELLVCLELVPAGLAIDNVGTG